MAIDHEPVAILGLGAMGHGMALSTLRAGLPTVIWNRNPDAGRDLVDRGAERAGSAGEAAARAAVVITMVTDTDAVRSVAVDHGMLEGLRPAAIWAQMSTIGVAGTEQLAALAESKRPDAVFVDAPVAGSKVPAEQGKLMIYASGPDGAREAATPVFDALGQRTLWLGRAGMGSRMKVINNTLLAFTCEGLANSIALAHRLGVGDDAVMEAFQGNPLLSPWQAAKLTRISHGEFSAEFALALALKDVRLALQAGGEDAFIVLGCLAGEWQRVVDRGLGHEDLTVVTRVLEE